MSDSNKFKVRLESYSHGTASQPTSTVIFNVMPVLAETIAVEYQSFDPVHMPGGYYTYKGTKSSMFDLSDVKFVSRNREEATKNQEYRATLKGWTKPYFGFGTESGSGTPTSRTKFEYQEKLGGSDETVPLTPEQIAGVLARPGEHQLGVAVDAAARAGKLTDGQRDFFSQDSVRKLAMRALQKLDTNTNYQNKSNKGPGQYKKVPVGSEQVDQPGKRFLGAPPEVLYLTAYSDSVNTSGSLNKVSNITRVPVVITNLTITYPNDVDYIPTTSGEPFPIIMSISLSLVETHSPKEYELFDLFKYRKGLLPGF